MRDQGEGDHRQETGEHLHIPHHHLLEMRDLGGEGELRQETGDLLPIPHHRLQVIHPDQVQSQGLIGANNPTIEIELGTGPNTESLRKVQAM